MVPGTATARPAPSVPAPAAATPAGATPAASAAAPATVTFAKALNQALADAMTADDKVLVFCEDVAELGGVFR